MYVWIVDKFYESMSVLVEWLFIVLVDEFWFFFSIEYGRFCLVSLLGSLTLYLFVS